MVLLLRIIVDSEYTIKLKLQNNPYHEKEYSCTMGQVKINAVLAEVAFQTTGRL